MLQLIEGIFNISFMDSDPYFVGLAAYLTRTITRITHSFELLFEWYGKNSAVARSVDVETIRPNERRSPIVTSDTTDSLDSSIATSTSTAVTSIEECESIEACFTSSYI